jgi:hypothetical protein
LAGSLQLNINLVAPTLYCMKVRFTPILFFSLAVFVASCKLDPVIYPGQPGYVDTAPKTSGGSTTGTTSGTGSSGSTTGSGTGSTTGSGSTSGSGSGTTTGSGGSTGSGSGTTTGSGSGSSTSNSGLSGTWKITSMTDIMTVAGSTSTTPDGTPSFYSSITLDDNAKTAAAFDTFAGGNTVPISYTTSTSSGNNYIQFTNGFLDIPSGTQVHILSMTSTAMTWQFVLGNETVGGMNMETDVKIVFSKQ